MFWVLYIFLPRSLAHKSEGERRSTDCSTCLGLKTQNCHRVSCENPQQFAYKSLHFNVTCHALMVPSDAARISWRSETLWVLQLYDLWPTDTLQYQIPNIHIQMPFFQMSSSPFPSTFTFNLGRKKTVKHTDNPRNWAVSASRHPSRIWPLQPPPFQALLPHIRRSYKPDLVGEPQTTFSLKWVYTMHTTSQTHWGFRIFWLAHVKGNHLFGRCHSWKQPHDQDDIHSIFFPPADWQKVAVHRNNCQLTLSKAHFLLGPILRIH